MADRNALIRSLANGDIFHAEAPNGASLICLVLSVNKTSIRARRINTQEELEFDRETGKAESGGERIPCQIDSVAPLPAEIHGVFLRLDGKYQALMAMDEKSRFEDLDRLKLTDAEKKALSFVYSYYPSNPLPPLVS
ncbi:MAG: hypothetical protein WBD53_14770 [Xanthobacteraceae bacterium]